MKAKLIFLSFAMLVVTHIMAQDFQVPVSERNEKMAQGFNEGAYTKATSNEIRFTQTQKHLYATALSWPSNKQVVIKALALGSPHYPGKINRIELLGYGKVSFQRTADGLIIQLPQEQVNKIAPVFKIKK